MATPIADKPNPAGEAQVRIHREACFLGKLANREALYHRDESRFIPNWIKYLSRET